MLLLVILAWVIQPRWFSKEAGLPAKSAAGSGDIKKSKVFPSFTSGNFPKKKEKAANTLGELETDAGRAVPGEKILRFKDSESFRRFLAAAPSGVVRGRIDPLLALRVQAGEWLRSFPSSSFLSMGSNFYVEAPKAPVEVLAVGDARYREVGDKALDLMGAGAVTSDWGKGVKVALLDTEIQNAGEAPGPEAGHGTAMLSLINGFSGPVQGAGPGSTVLNFPVLDGDGVGNSFDLASAILQAVDQGARVINMSLGSEGDSSVVRDAVAYALAKNVVLVAAAGNEAVNRVSYPAAYDGVVSVGSVDADRQHLYFSNRGPGVSLVAPGDAVLANWPGGKRVEVSGTSASTALVSGVVAALLSKEPSLTGSKAVELLRQYADDTGAAGRDDETGYGVVDLQRVLERNQRGIVDLAVAGVLFDPQGKLTVTVQNRGTESVNSPVLEIGVGGNFRKFYLGSIAPGQSLAETLQFDGVRARQEGGIAGSAAVHVPRGGDQRPANDLWSQYFEISK